MLQRSRVLPLADVYSVLGYLLRHLAGSRSTTSPPEGNNAPRRARKTTTAADPAAGSRAPAAGKAPSPNHSGHLNSGVCARVRAGQPMPGLIEAV